jgi:hypothetical protein
MNTGHILVTYDYNIAILQESMSYIHCGIQFGVLVKIFDQSSKNLDRKLALGCQSEGFYHSRKNREKKKKR